MIELPRDLKDPLLPPPWPHPASIYSGMQIMMSPGSPGAACLSAVYVSTYLRIYVSTSFYSVRR